MQVTVRKRIQEKENAMCYKYLYLIGIQILPKTSSEGKRQSKLHAVSFDIGLIK